MSTKSKRIKVAARPSNPPRNRDEAEVLVGRIADLKHEEQSLKAAMDAELTAVRQRYETRLSALAVEVSDKVKDMEGWAAADRTQWGDRKSVDMLHGVVGWRVNPPSVKPLRGYTWQAVLDRILALGRSEFVRTKEEVNKEALLAAREVEDLRPLYVTVEQEDTFFVEPKLTTVETREVAS